MKSATEIVAEERRRRRLYSYKRRKGVIEQIFWNLRRIRFFMTTKLYRYRGTNYGLLEAFFFPTTIRFFLAYTAITQRILEGKGIFSVLEVGAGGPGISCFLDTNRHRICLTDIDDNALYQAKDGVDLVVVDGCELPFKDNTFDVAVSVDAVEHVPKAFRKDFLRELKRAARTVIIHLPLRDDEGTYVAREYPSLLRRLHRKVAYDEIPRMNELREEFPGAVYEGLQNCDIRYFYTMLAYSSIRLFTGLVYLMFLKKRNYQPPYYSCMVTFHKEQQ